MDLLMMRPLFIWILAVMLACLHEYSEAQCLRDEVKEVVAQGYLRGQQRTQLKSCFEIILMKLQRNAGKQNLSDRIKCSFFIFAVVLLCIYQKHAEVQSTHQSRTTRH